MGDRLTRTGVAVTAAPDVTDAVRLLASRRFALCVVDLADDRAAIGAIRVLRSRYAHQPIAAIIDPANPLVAGEALGAATIDLLPWPFDERDVLVVLANARDRSVADPAAASEKPDVEPLFAQSAAMQSVTELVRAAADIRGGVLISGEPGTGRELVARAIHRGSRRQGTGTVRRSRLCGWLAAGARAAALRPGGRPPAAGREAARRRSSRPRRGCRSGHRRHAPAHESRRDAGPRAGKTGPLASRSRSHGR